MYFFVFVEVDEAYSYVARSVQDLVVGLPDLDTNDIEDWALSAMPGTLRDFKSDCDTTYTVIVLNDLPKQWVSRSSKDAEE